MRIILSHVNLDFDGLACMVCAGKLYPGSILIKPKSIEESVQKYLKECLLDIEFTDFKEVGFANKEQLIEKVFGGKNG